jgi:hypothetical protein
MPISASDVAATSSRQAPKILDFLMLGPVTRNIPFGPWLAFAKSPDLETMLPLYGSVLMLMSSRGTISSSGADPSLSPL